VLQDGDEATVVVAHSYGGIVTAEAAAGVGSVRHLLLVSSYLPEVGQRLSDFGDGTPAPFLDIDPDTGTFGVRPQFLVETFLQDCDPDTQAQAADKLARQSVQVTAQPVGAAHGSRCPRPTSSAPRTRAPPRGGSATSLARPAPSSNSTLATTRSCPNQPPFRTCS